MTTSTMISGDLLPQGFTFTPAGHKPDREAAAKEFEALLIARLLKAAREAGETLGNPPEQTGAEGYRELAEEHVARSIAQSEAFGIARMILKSMEKFADENTALAVEEAGPKQPALAAGLAGAAIEPRSFRFSGDQPIRTSKP